MNKYLVIEGQPRPKQRPRIVQGRAYTPKETRNYELMIAEAWQWQCKEFAPKGEAIEVILDFYLQIPKSWSLKKRVAAEEGKIVPASRPDIDNLAKSILDGLNGIAYEDDSQIVSLILAKYYSNRPRIEIHIRSV